MVGKLEKVFIKKIVKFLKKQVLAVTATASTATAQEICRLFNISEQDVIKDVTVRNNLRLKDMREAPRRARRGVARTRMVVEILLNAGPFGMDSVMK